MVIAPYSDRSTVLTSTDAAGSSSTTYLPVALSRDEAKSAGSSYSQVMLADRHEIKHYLKAIHRTLKERS